MVLKKGADSVIESKSKNIFKQVGYYLKYHFTKLVL